MMIRYGIPYIKSLPWVYGDLLLTGPVQYENYKIIDL